MLKLTQTYVIDTQKEHSRIEKCFSDDLESRVKLHELIYLVEACKWQDAYNLFVTEWWSTYCPIMECSRIEFIGHVETVPEHMFSGFYSYLDLIKDMLTCENYVCEQIKETANETAT